VSFGWGRRGEGVTHDGGDGDGDDHYETEFGFKDSAVATGHPTTDYVGDFARERRAEDTAHERGKVEKSDGQGGHIVGSRLMTRA